VADPQLFGTPKAQWEIINGLANWFAAFGSFAAAGVALYVANRSGKPKATLSVGTALLVQPGQRGPHPEFVVFRIVNTGDRPIRITSIGWRVGVFRKSYAMQMFDDSMSAKLPIDLTHSQEAHWYVPIHARERGWYEYFAKGFLGDRDGRFPMKLRAQAFTSVGHAFNAVPDGSLMKKLRSAMRET
jgi:hypothetical protein